MKNLRTLALLLLSIAATNVVFAKKSNGATDDVADVTTNKKTRQNKRMTRSEKEALQNEEWVEGVGAPVNPSEIRYEGRAGQQKGRRNGVCSKSNCNTCSEQPCGKPPVCRKLVPVEACADKHLHTTYSYTCPVGYTELPAR